MNCFSFPFIELTQNCVLKIFQNFDQREHVPRARFFRVSLISIHLRNDGPETLSLICVSKKDCQQMLPGRLLGIY